jgi:hypothetical protein
MQLKPTTRTVSCAVRLPVNANNVMEKCSDQILIQLWSESAGQSMFVVVVAREARAVGLRVVHEGAELGTVTYTPEFHEVDLDACEPCREARPGRLLVSPSGELAKG